MDAATIVGLLADDHRRRCWAALELGASSRDEIVAATGLSMTEVGRALARLVSGGLVVAGSDGGLHPVVNVFPAAARDALSRPPSTEHDDQPEDVRKVLRSFIANGRITRIPVAAAKRRILLDWLAQDFEPGRRYSEKMVNLILGQRHDDTASLRRYLVDEGLLDRAEGEYWRSGGSVGP
jgi:hypothetical protein